MGSELRGIAVVAKGITLAPCGLIIERIEPAPDTLIIVARAASGSAACPTCGQMSDSIHSRYQRRLSDLPSQGKPVRLSILARRFRCLAIDCRQRIFVERLDATVTARSPAEHHGWRGWFTISGSRWVADRARVSRGVFFFR